MIQNKNKKAVLSWAMYDWANSVYITTVMVAFFPVFFSEYWSQADAVHNTFRLGVANAISSLVVVLSAPIIGSIADAHASRKKFLLFFIALGVISNALLVIVPESQWLQAAIFFILANIAFQAGNIFYDSLLVCVSTEENLDKNSALGYALGYLGGAILLFINILMVTQPETFGLIDKVAGVHTSIITVSIWWAVFSIPIMLFVKEKQVKNTTPLSQVVSEAFTILKNTFDHVKELKQTFIFLAAYFIYIDGIYTVMRMSIDYGIAIGLNSSDLIKALLLTQVIGFPTTLLYTKLDKLIGMKNAILLGIFAYGVLCVYATQITDSTGFYIVAALIGVFQGGTQALSRALYASIIPKNQPAEFFGFYNMLGKLSAVVGPLLVGATTLLTGSNRYGISVCLILFIAGGYILSRVDVTAARAAVSKHNASV